MSELEKLTEPLKLKDREPVQGEQFTEPKLGGLYPIAGIFVGVVAVGAAAAAIALL